MACYYFHIRDHDGLERDAEGIEFPDDAAALRGAIAAAKEMVVEAVVGEGIIDNRKIEIVTADGELVAIVPLQSVIKI
ncbi:MAG: DUF6894 family protein [Allorhizobium sp.]